jgi:hypothetical protein
LNHQIDRDVTDSYASPGEMSDELREAQEAVSEFIVKNIGSNADDQLTARLAKLALAKTAAGYFCRESDHPIPQRLAIHPTDLRRLFPAKRRKCPLGHPAAAIEVAASRVRRRKLLRAAVGLVDYAVQAASTLAAQEREAFRPVVRPDSADRQG